VWLGFTFIRDAVSIHVRAVVVAPRVSIFAIRNPIVIRIFRTLALTADDLFGVIVLSTEASDKHGTQKATRQSVDSKTLT
jgi:hypothetical protein